MAIDIGAGAAVYAYNCATGNTEIDKTNPANATGVLTTFQVYAGATITNFKVGTAYGSGTSFTSRDYVSIGEVTSGSVQTFTGLACDVQTGDCIINHPPSGYIRHSTTGGSGIVYRSGDSFDGLVHTYTSGAAAGRVSLYSTGINVATVTTQEESDVSSSGMTGNGNITDTGGSGSDVTRRGFCYMEGTSGDPDANGTTLYAGEVVGSTANPSVAAKAFTAVNCTGLTKANGVLKIDLKCDAPEKLSNTGYQFELTSAGKSDTNEWDFYPPRSEITTSYKTFYFPLSACGSQGGELDVTAINYIRWYASSTDSSNITVSWRNAAILIGQTAVFDDGTFGTGSFSKSITGLSPSTNYRIRAYAVNVAETSYGTTVQARTLDHPYAIIF